jgi:hypothetical protein
VIDRVQTGLCDTCGEPVFVGDIVYSIAKPGPRHARCNDRRQEKAQKQLKESLANIKAALARLKEKGL